MITKIVQALKGGLSSAISVVTFGDLETPNPPYVVIKQENDSASRGTVYRIIGHFSAGQQLFLEDLMRKDIPEILDDFKATDRNSNLNQLEIADNNTLPELIISNDDKTISMEILYFKPDRIFG